MSTSTIPADAVRVDLGPHRNNAAFLAPGVEPADGFDGFGRAYPASELGGAADALGLPGDLGHGVADNVACEGQVLVLGEPVLLRGLDVVGAGSGGTVSETLLLEPGPDGGGPAARARVELSDFLSRRPVFDDTCFAHSSFLYDVGGRPESGAEPRLWRCAVRFPQPLTCGRITLPVNPDLHVVGVWLLPAPAGPEAATNR
ncbi:hypothetical protein AQI95_34660 [Streptomyces yokosukanensis]|uniref:Uncharacterized protein n=1 Tax=Streptomyces yokosukanensis TaxID=67386 RepID=A0A101NW65_9ACTN|nr:hypothetical protein [Streptomyces yokosukanensis]KUN00442.1 hypothetical protein AQI95_34660 [Streptomyces yokosukanensis]